MPEIPGVRRERDSTVSRHILDKKEGADVRGLVGTMRIWIAQLIAGLDIVQLETENKDLREQARQLESLLSSIPEGLCFKDADQKIVRASQSFLTLFGTNSSSAQGQKLTTLHQTNKRLRAPLAQQEVMEAAVIKSGTPVFDQPLSMELADQKQYFALSCYPQKDGDKKVTGTWTMMRDRTEEVQEREESQRYRIFMEALFNSFEGHSIFAKDPEGRFIFVNDAFCRSFQHTREELLGKTDFDFAPLHLARQYQAVDRKLLREGCPIDFNGPSADGKEVEQTMKRVVKDETGQSIGIAAMFWNIGAQVKAEEAVLRERDMLQAVMDSAPFLIYFREPGGKLVRGNQALGKMLKQDIKKMEGSLVRSLLTSRSSSNRKKDETLLLHKQSILDQEEEIETPDGRKFHLESDEIPIPGPDGKIHLVLCISRDITKKKQDKLAFEGALNRHLQAMNTAAEGDLLVRSQEGDDFLGRCGTALNRMVSELSRLVSLVKGRALDLASTAEEMSSSTTLVVNRFQKEAADVSSTAGSVENMTGSVEQVVKIVQACTQYASKISELIQNGTQLLAGLQQNTDQSKEAAQKTMQLMDTLSKSSGDIHKVLAVLEELTDQSNLLALNAAIEAARAGDAGRGFSVVAHEIRALSERTGNSIKEVRAMVRTITEQTAQVKTAATESSSQATAAHAKAAQVKIFLEDMLANVQPILSAMEQIEQAARTQLHTFQQVSTAMSGTSASIQESRQSMLEFQMAIDHLHQDSKTLGTLVEKFQVGDDSPGTLPQPPRAIVSGTESTIH